MTYPDTWERATLGELSWGKANELGSVIDSILNRTPLTADTNRKVVRDRLPNAYLPDLIEQNGETTVRATLETHLISPIAFDILLRDPFTVNNFEDFIAERSRTLHDAIEDLLIKERLDLPPRLREFDARIERIELRLRAIVAEKLEHDPAQLPENVSAKVSERIAKVLRKSPGVDSSQFEILARRLEYSDLRELQDIIVNRQLWSRFESLFGSRESLGTRFAQLAELRNAIRHSRSVDEVTRKDGEAALTWFEQVLAQPLATSTAATP